MRVDCVRPRNLFAVGFIVAMVILASRLAWNVSQIETGSDTLNSVASNATFRNFGLGRKPFFQMTPDEAAEFWFNAANRIPEHGTDKAALQMGAALILNDPPVRYSFSQTPVGTVAVPLNTRSALTTECIQSSKELAARATEEEPGNMDWWRIRAILATRFHNTEMPFDENVVAQLDDFASHDPDNGLYQYLAAYYLFSHCIKVDWSTEQKTLTVVDADQLLTADRYFLEAQQKPALIFSSSEHAAIRRFAEFSKLTLDEQSFLNTHVEIDIRGQTLIRRLGRLQRDRINHALREEKVREAADIAKSVRVMNDRFSSSDQSSSLRWIVAHEKPAFYFTIKDASRNHPALLVESAMIDIDRLLHEANLSRHVKDGARRDVLAQNTQATPNIALLISLFIAFMTIPQIVVVLAGMLLVLLLVRITVVQKRATPGTFARWVWSPVSLLASLAITLTVFGLCPTHIISDGVQEWSFTVLAVGISVGIPAWGLFRWLRGRRERGHRLQFSLKTVMITTSAICLLMGLPALMGVKIDLFDGIPFAISFPKPKPDPDLLFLSEQSMIVRIAFSWAAYYGHLLTIGIWCIVLVCSNFPAGKEVGQNEEESLQPKFWQSFASRLVISLQKPVQGLCAILVIVSLAIAPSWLQLLDDRIQPRLKYYRNPDAFYVAADAREAAIRQDTDELKSYEDFVRDEIEAALEDMLTEDGSDAD